MKTVAGKVVVLGHQGVGKTSTVMRYVEDTFAAHIAPTVGASFFTCRLCIKDVIVKMQVWDTAGQERFKAMAPMFYRNANAALLVFDLTSYKSFEDMKGWVQELKRNVEETIILCVVGNKLDLPNLREVPRDEALQYSKSIGSSYHECSAKTDQGVRLVFEDIARCLIKLVGQNARTLQVYDDGEGLMAKSSQLEATDTAREETVNLSISNIAHGKSVRQKCC
ncbi:uncharacterized protein LOC132701615 isoform X1 [Cylas formicarius]|uniref:uncharacterized protein LOC132701615 isoform X1 n=1 Tax=Cylas formicarius TaxID=197179 RepID=UPI002958D9EE|nr:uncharacterized protein LOC132701615 isoform X1 [Cylas formicarius]